MAETEYVRPYAVELGRRLRAARRRRHLTLDDVEEQTNGEFHPATLGSYERADRPISVARLQRLAVFYDVSVNELLPGNDWSVSERTRKFPGASRRPGRRLDAAPAVRWKTDQAWKYRLLEMSTTDVPNISVQVGAQGLQGWELVTVTPLAGRMSLWVFKQPDSPDEHQE